MGWDMSAQEGDSSSAIGALPHIVLPLLLLLAFAVPPFSGRGVLFASLIMATDYATKISPWPQNVGESRPMRYGMAGSWLFTLPVLERILLHVPERDFWLLDEAQLVREGRPTELNWSKILSLATSPRAIGWNFGNRTLNTMRDDLRVRKIQRSHFVLDNLGRVILAYLALDTVVFAVKESIMPSSWSWNPVVICQIAYVELLMGISVYTTMTIQFNLAAAIAVAFTSSQPEVV